jgi:hypothetical protein
MNLRPTSNSLRRERWASGKWNSPRTWCLRHTPLPVLITHLRAFRQHQSAKPRDFPFIELHQCHLDELASPHDTFITGYCSGLFGGEND